MLDDPSKEEYLHKACGLEEATFKFAMSPHIVDYVLADLDKRIKHDNSVKLSVFFTGISAFLHEPINLFQKGESGIGKSYNTVQALKYYPPETTLLLGGLSPKALIHDYGTLLTEDGQPATDIEKPEKPRSSDYADAGDYKQQQTMYNRKIKEYWEIQRKTYTLIELTGKTLVFLETPEYEAFRLLYPILSHDTERIEYRFVDKPGKGQMRTVHVVIKGWPATIFLTVGRKFMAELATRSFTVTPENSKKKIEAANQLTNQKNCYPWTFNEETEETIKIRELLLAVRNWFQTAKANIIIPFEGLYEFFPRDIVRDMRDFQHFSQLLKTVTALHLFQRPIITINKKQFVVTTLYDVAVAINIYSEIFETTRTGTERALLDFYHNIIKQRSVWHLKDLTEEYNAQSSRKASSETVRVKLDRLAQIGYVNVEKDEVDKRLNVYKPLMQKDEELSNNPLKTLDWLIFKSKMEEGFENWKKNILQIEEVNINKFFALNRTGKSKFTITELESDVLEQTFFSIYKGVACRIFSKAKENLEEENKHKTNQTSKIRTVMDNSKIKSLIRLTSSYGNETCLNCKQTKQASYQVNLIDDSWGLLCEDCGYKLEKAFGDTEK